jgi:2-oxoglutarate dehydrogenase E2 component (dihydrolipoamide succinyltransferase)
MKIEVKIPDIGESINETTVARVLVKSGDRVERDSELFEIESVKQNQVLYAPESGVVEVLVHENESYPIGKTLAIITASDGISPTSSPLRRKMSSTRLAIGSRLLQSIHTTAPVTTFNEVDLSLLQKLRDENKDSFFNKYGVKLGLTCFFVLACADALKAFPDVNSYIDGDDIVQNPTIDIAVAIETTFGLLVPVIKAIETLTLADIEKKIDDCKIRAESNKLKVEELSGGGFTITNGGIFGSLLSTPIINPPQCAILGMHKIQKRAVVIGDEIVVRPMMYLALTYDHRLIDGKCAITFLNHIKSYLENSSKLSSNF